MRNFSMVSALLAIALAAACATSSPAPASKAATTATATTPAPASQGSGLTFTVKPTDAEIFIDGTSTGKVTDLSGSQGFLKVKPGIYQVSLKRQGFVTWRAEVTVGEGTEAIHVNMVEGP